MRIFPPSPSSMIGSSWAALLLRPAEETIRRVRRRRWAWCLFCFRSVKTMIFCHATLAFIINEIGWVTINKFIKEYSTVISSLSTGSRDTPIDFGHVSPSSLYSPPLRHHRAIGFQSGVRTRSDQRGNQAVEGGKRRMAKGNAGEARKETKIFRSFLSPLYPPR